MGHPEDERMLRRCTVSVEEITGNQIAPERFAAVLTAVAGKRLPGKW